MRKDKVKTKKNIVYIEAYKETFKKLKKGGKQTSELVKKYYSQIDKAVKNNIIHKNKGNRMKSKVKKFLKPSK